MTDLATLKAELTRDEGLRLRAYRDSAGYFTIGVGHLLGSSPRMSDITRDETDALFERDIANAATTLVQYVTIVPEGARRRALINMAFNLGNRLGEFKHFLAAVNAQQWATAGDEMMKSAWAGQVGDRATRLHDMIVRGEP